MLLLASSVCGLFKWRQFEPEVILLAVGWYQRFSLSYRDVEELLAERGLFVDHVTVWSDGLTRASISDRFGVPGGRSPATRPST
jgi:transposase-like protein